MRETRSLSQLPYRTRLSHPFPPEKRTKEKPIIGAFTAQQISQGIYVSDDELAKNLIDEALGLHITPHKKSTERMDG